MKKITNPQTVADRINNNMVDAYLMKTYTIYTARKQYNDFNNFIGTVKANNIEQVKDGIRKQFNLNPYYTVIRDEENGASIELFNKHLGFAPNN